MKGSFGCCRQGSRRQQADGNRHDFIIAGMGGVGHRELRLAKTFGVPPAGADIDPHLIVLLLQARKPFPNEEQDQPRMGEPDARLFPGKPKARKMRGDQIDEQRNAQEVAAGEDREKQPGAAHFPKNEEGVKYLCWTPQTPRWTWSSVAANTSTIERISSATVRRSELIRAITGLSEEGMIQGARTVWRNARKAGFASATAADGPVSLKNQVPPFHGTRAATMGELPSEASITSKWRP